MRTVSGILVCGLLSLASGCRMCASPYDYLGPVDDCSAGGFAGWDYRRNSVLGYGDYVTDGDYVEGEYADGDYVDGQVIDGAMPQGEYNDVESYDAANGGEAYEEMGPAIEGELAPVEEYYEESAAPSQPHRHGRLQPIPDPRVQ